MRSSSAPLRVPDAVPGVAPSLSLAPNPRVSRAIPLLLLGAVLLPRLLLFPINENLFGDAVARTELAEKWLRHPHWISSFKDGAYQFGPLHLYLIGFLLKLWPSPEHAGRFVSLLFGTLSVLPLYYLTRRMFGWRAGVWAGLAFSLWSIHLQISTTAGSEALHLFLMFCLFAFLAKALDNGKFAPLVWAAGCLNLACATRYDAWMFIPVLGLLLALWGRDRVAGVTRATLFCLMCLPFPLVWMEGNELDLQDPFYPIHYVEIFHRSWVGQEVARLGQLGFRLEGLFFWPAAAAVTMTLPIALVAVVGMVRTFRDRPQLRWTVWASLIPTLYFTFRSAVRMDFVPLARFTVVEVALLFPFVEPGFRALFPASKSPLAKTVLAGMLALAVLFPAGLSALTYHREGKWADTLRPISPISTNPLSVRRTAEFLKKQVLSTGAAVALDSAPQYLDLQVAFFSGLPQERLYRFRWPEFEAQVASAPPEYLILADGGGLSQKIPRGPQGLVWEGARFEELPGFVAPFHVYQKQ